MNPGRFQRARLYIDRRDRNVLGYFYVNGERLRRKLCSFAEAGLGPAGNPISDTARENAKRARLYRDRYRDVEKELLAGQPDKHPAAPRISAKMDDWIEDARTLRRPKTIELYEIMREQYRAAVGDHPLYERDSETKIRRYDVAKADRFRAHLVKRGLSLETVHQRLRTLRTFLHWAQARSLLDVVPRFTMPAREDKVPAVLSDQDVIGLFQVIEHHRQESVTKPQRRCVDLHELALVLYLGTGRRLAAIHSRTWEDVDLKLGRLFVGGRSLEDGEVFVDKARAEFWVPLAPTVIAHLRDWRKRNPTDHWFMDDGTGNLAFKKDALRHAFWRYLHIKPPLGLGLPSGRIKPTHAFRAAYITEMFKRGVDLKTIMENVGHRKMETTLGYISEPGALQQAAVNTYDKRLQTIMRRRKFKVVRGKG